MKDKNLSNWASNEILSKEFGYKPVVFKLSPDMHDRDLVNIS